MIEVCLAGSASLGGFRLVGESLLGLGIRMCTGIGRRFWILCYARLSAHKKAEGTSLCFQFRVLKFNFLCLFQYFRWNFNRLDGIVVAVVHLHLRLDCHHFAPHVDIKFHIDFHAVR
ncbi:hypothetical protein DFR62_2822 [Planococcus citreus]|uniref:Uncharacterized protein n=1 Tax=Planococcus citreus TaxID=1373 RepID=A0A497YDS9_9BACL|nr:hypothetical protein DFR62_2822 [Planococcus citreus]